MERNSGLSDSSVSDFIFDGDFCWFFEDGPSKVYFYIKGGRRIYIFYKLEDVIALMYSGM